LAARRPVVDMVPATAAHAIKLGCNMRQADVNEVWASHRHTPVTAVQSAIAQSDYAWTMTIDGEVAACFGIVASNIISGIGSPWALTADIVDRYPREFYEASTRVLSYFRLLYPTLFNAIHSRNTRSLQWARRVGFTVSEIAMPFGYNGELFHPILMGEVGHV
jgi:hypothetical protein